MNKHILNRIYLKLRPDFELRNNKFYPIAKYSDITLDVLQANPIGYKFSIGSALRACWITIPTELTYLGIDAESISNWHESDLVDSIVIGTKKLCADIEKELEQFSIEHGLLKYALSEVHYYKRLLIDKTSIKYEVSKHFISPHAYYNVYIDGDKLIMSRLGKSGAEIFNLQNPILHIKVRQFLRTEFS